MDRQELSRCNEEKRQEHFKLCRQREMKRVHGCVGVSVCKMEVKRERRAETSKTTGMWRMVGGRPGKRTEEKLGL